ncbi:Crp/Fnr family transcriptional regulator [Candidatus Daviesbacteria bacterium]|nr:Crp/Fnr family transcriptional regulator [Candidatus Daviesbacteria bacterium]
MDSSVKRKLDQFFSRFKNYRFKKGEILIRPNEVPPGVFYLTEGVVRRYSISSSGEELTLNIFKPISFFPMSWVINDTLTHHYFEALTEVKVIKAPKEDVKNFILKETDILVDLVSRIYRGLDGFMLRMEYLMSGNAYTKLITELLINTKRFGETVKDGTTLKIKLTQRDLAAQTGIARETVSRELKKLKKSGLIDLNNRFIIVKDIHNLEQELVQY